MLEWTAVRFGTTLLANLLRAGFSFLSGVLIARGLGASGYGDLNFLLGSFAAMSQLLEMGTSSAFYTFLSKRPRSRTFLALYLGWLAVQFFATALFVGLLLPGDVLTRLWVGHGRGIILQAFCASFLITQVWGMVSQLGEAVRKTVLVQTASVFQAGVHLALIGATVLWNWLTVPIVLWLLVGEYMLLAVVLTPVLVRANLIDQRDQGEDYRAILSEYAAYCKPLVVYGWVSFLYAYADLWLLQRFGGAQQQGFFAISQQYATIGLIATTSCLKVFWKEIAEARERHDYQRIQTLYASVSRGLYVIGAWLCCLVVPYSQEILTWTVGTAYKDAWICLSLLLFIPVHQSLGQVQGTFFYASGETGRYARLGLLMMVVSLPITYFMLAPGSAAIPGLGLGALGLALKGVVLQIIGVNIQAYRIASFNRWRFDVRYQILLLGALLGVAWTGKWVSEGVFILLKSSENDVSMMLVGTAFYAGLSLVLFSSLPSVTGLTREQVKAVLTAMIGRPRPVVA